MSIQVETASGTTKPLSMEEYNNIIHFIRPTFNKIIISLLFQNFQWLNWIPWLSWPWKMGF